MIRGIVNADREAIVRLLVQGYELKMQVRNRGKVTLQAMP
jgi:hypothetical protein